MKEMKLNFRMFFHPFPFSLLASFSSPRLLSHIISVSGTMILDEKGDQAIEHEAYSIKLLKCGRRSEQEIIGTDAKERREKNLTNFLYQAILIDCADPNT